MDEELHGPLENIMSFVTRYNKMAGKCFYAAALVCDTEISGVGERAPFKPKATFEHGSGSVTRNGNLYKPTRCALNQCGRLVELCGHEEASWSHTKNSNGDRTHPKGFIHPSKR
jgi:hypothetical protein